MGSLSLSAKLEGFDCLGSVLCMIRNLANGYGHVKNMRSKS